MAYQWDSFREPRTPERDRQSEMEISGFNNFK